MATCSICSRVLDVKYDPLSLDCGGDCVLCMAEAGDPDCQRCVDRLYMKHAPSTTHHVKASQMDGLKQALCTLTSKGWMMPEGLVLLELTIPRKWNH